MSTNSPLIDHQCLLMLVGKRKTTQIIYSCELTDDTSSGQSWWKIEKKEKTFLVGLRLKKCVDGVIRMGIILICGESCHATFPSSAEYDQQKLKFILAILSRSHLTNLIFHAFLSSLYQVWFDFFSLYYIFIEFTFSRLLSCVFFLSLRNKNTRKKKKSQREKFFHFECRDVVFHWTFFVVVVAFLFSGWME